MSVVDIKIPSPGESITEVEIGNWLKSDGDYVQVDETICEIESDKATLPLIAENSGKLKIILGSSTIALSKDVNRLSFLAQLKVITKLNEENDNEHGDQY